MESVTPASNRLDWFGLQYDATISVFSSPHFLNLPLDANLLKGFLSPAFIALPHVHMHQSGWEEKQNCLHFHTATLNNAQFWIKRFHFKLLLISEQNSL